MVNKDRLIYANDIWRKTFVCDEVAEVRKFIEQAPTVDAVEVVHSQWEITDIEHAYGTKCYHCPECGEDEWRHDKPNYCPNCGVDMR